MAEGVAMFKYLGRPLYKTDDDWLALGRNIMRVRSVWGEMGTIIQQEGSDPRVAEMFYRAVVQAILIYSLEMWVLLVAMGKKIEGAHTGFLRQIMGK